MSDNNNILPFQVEHLIQSMMNKKDNVHIRGNYRMRLQAIRDAIDISIRKYDNEMFTIPDRNSKRK